MKHLNSCSGSRNGSGFSNSLFRSFFTKRLYGRVSDCWNRPIAGPPDRTIQVCLREWKSSSSFYFPSLSSSYSLEFTGEILECINMASYNYLGFGGFDRTCTLPCMRCLADGNGGSDRRSTIQEQLEEQLAKFLNQERCIVTGMGFATNSILISSLLHGLRLQYLQEQKASSSSPSSSFRVLVISDEFNHRSIIEGIRLGGADQISSFKHNDMKDLEKIISSAFFNEEDENFDMVIIFIEGVYSMEGTFVNLPELMKLKKSIERRLERRSILNLPRILLWLDEAHSIGAVGKTGKGVFEYFDIQDEGDNHDDDDGGRWPSVDIFMGTFSKSFSSIGGYVASNKKIIELIMFGISCALSPSARPGAGNGIINAAHNLIVSSSTFTAVAHKSCSPISLSSICALQVLESLKALQTSRGLTKLKTLEENIRFFRNGLLNLGCDLSGDEGSPIICIMIYNPEKLVKFSRELLKRRVAVVVVGYPATSLLYGRARFCISAAHTRNDLNYVLDMISEVGDEIGIFYKRPSSFKLLHKNMRLYTRRARSRRRGSSEPNNGRYVDHGGNNMITNDNGNVNGHHANNGFCEDYHHHHQSFAVVYDVEARAADPLMAISSNTDRIALDVISSYGMGSCSPRGFYGTSIFHHQLEKIISEFLNLPSTIIYSHSISVCSSVLNAYVGCDDILLVPALDHIKVSDDDDMSSYYSLQCGLDMLVMKMKKGKIYFYHDRDELVYFASRISSSSSSSSSCSNKIFIFYRSCYGGGLLNNNSSCDVNDVIEIKNQLNNIFQEKNRICKFFQNSPCKLIIDDCKGIFHHGQYKRGIIDELKNNFSALDIDLLIGSLDGGRGVEGSILPSYSFGGFCAGNSKSLINQQVLSASGYCFSAAAPAYVAAAAAEAIKVQFERNRILIHDRC